MYQHHDIDELYMHLGDRHDELDAILSGSGLERTYLCEEMHPWQEYAMNDGDMALYHYLMYWATLAGDM